MSRYDEIRTMAREKHHEMACSTPSRLSHHKALCYGGEVEYYCEFSDIKVEED